MGTDGGGPGPVVMPPDAVHELLRRIASGEHRPARLLTFTKAGVVVKHADTKRLRRKLARHGLSGGGPESGAKGEV